MSNLDTLWVFTGFFFLILVGISIRELLLLLRIPPRHPDRGIYWFNFLFLLVAAGAVLYTGYYIDQSRQTLEQMIAVPPSAHYAIERNRLLHDTTWVYVTETTEESVRNFYRTSAEANHITFIEDGARMSFTLPSGNIFLTLARENNKTILYFSREGEMKSVIRE